jgi:hypothetical protein
MVDNFFKKINDDLSSIVDLCYSKDDLALLAGNFFQALYNTTGEKILKQDNEILNNPNDIIYRKSGLVGYEPDIESYTTIEYILSRL